MPKNEIIGPFFGGAAFTFVLSLHCYVNPAPENGIIWTKTDPYTKTTTKTFAAADSTDETAADTDSYPRTTPSGTFPPHPAARCDSG